MFSKYFGASFVFKSFSKFAFKNNLDKWGFDLKWTLNLYFKIYLKFQNSPLSKVVEFKILNNFCFWTNL
jgi:hypothetical protein